MKTIYKFIEFQANWEDDQWLCINRKHRDKLGVVVEYYDDWRRFVFQAASDRVVFSQDCLLDIIHFIKQLEYLEKEKAFKAHDELDRRGMTV